MTVNFFAVESSQNRKNNGNITLGMVPDFFVKKCYFTLRTGENFIIFCRITHFYTFLGKTTQKSGNIGPTKIFNLSKFNFVSVY